jgi:hypothetical protein
MSEMIGVKSAFFDQARALTTEIPIEDRDRLIKVFESSGDQARRGTANVVGEWSNQRI